MNGTKEWEDEHSGDDVFNQMGFQLYEHRQSECGLNCDLAPVKADQHLSRAPFIHCHSWIRESDWFNNVSIFNVLLNVENMLVHINEH